MAPNIYVDPAATGANDGTSWTDAYTDMQDALDTVAAGEEIGCRGTQTLTTSLTVDTTPGTSTNPIYIVGYNGSGVDDGTMFTIDADSTAANCLLCQENYYSLKNIKMINATGDGWNENGQARYWIFLNCEASSNGGDGFAGSSNTLYHAYVNCRANSNSTRGWQSLRQSVCIACEANGNGSNGYATSGATCVYCIAHNNGAAGFAGFTAPFTAIGCTADANTTQGILSSSSVPGVIHSSRATNNTHQGIAFTRNGVEDFNYTAQNGNLDNLADTISGGNSDLDGTGGTPGYVDQANDNFNLVVTALLKRITLPIGSLNTETNNCFAAAGLVPTPDFPDVGNVLDDDTVDGSAGTFQNIALDKVLTPNQWGDGGTEFTGTYTPDFPDVGNVLDDDTVNNQPGTFANVAEDDVENGVQWGADGTEFTGTLVEGITIRSISPATSRESGGGSATILMRQAGSTAGSVTIDGNAATVDTWTDTYIIVTIPAGSIGTGDVVVTAADSSFDTLTDGFSYVADSTSPILSRIEASIASLIEGIQVVDGYNYDWGTSNQQDKALQDADTVAEIRLSTEENVDDDGGSDAGSYLNQAFFDIRVQTTMDTLEATPIFDVNDYHNKVVDDLKKVFGINYSLEDNCNSIMYRGITERVVTENGDLFTPGHITTRWRVDYAQDRENPEVNANT